MSKKYILLSVIIFTAILFIVISENLIANRYRTELLNVQQEINDLKKNNEEKNKKINESEYFLKNINVIETTIYFTTADPLIGEIKENFTSFSIFYESKFYLITAGHCIEENGYKYTNFKFQSNNSNNWINAELLYYENDSEHNKDYAIFYSSLVKSGLYPDIQNQIPFYIFGNTIKKLNFISKYNMMSSKKGESGSPVLNSDCKVIGIIIKDNNSYTPINLVINSIKSLQNK